MQPEIGAILEGKVTGITKFGAFVTMPDNTSGLVHISEIANTYVSDVNEHLKLGQEVKVRVIGITENGKINLSIKKAVDTPPDERRRTAPRPAVQRSTPARQPVSDAAPAPGELYGQSADKSFEDKLKQFMQESDSKISSNRLYAAHRTGKRRK